MIRKCENCGRIWEFDDSDIIHMLPYPHYKCPHCNFWIPAF